MAITECEHGHLYDSEEYDACPYCNRSRNIIEFLKPEPPTICENCYQTLRYGEQYCRHCGTKRGTGKFKPTQNLIQTIYSPPPVNINHDEDDTNIEPIAGWLVCIKGNNIRKSFPVFPRINYIGRSERMDICLKKDTDILKEHHAQIAYDPKHRKFYLIPGASKNNIYLNDTPVYIPTELNAYDVISMGNTELLFIPLCGPKFSWENGVTKE